MGSNLHKQTWMGWLLGLILVSAFSIRVFHLSTNPPELFSDEITHVLSARSIFETGKDINGKFNIFLYNKIKLGTPLYGYLSATSTYIFGNNAFAIRLPAVIAGLVSVFLIFKLCFVITKDKTTSFLAAFSAAFTPWLIYFSRIGWEPALTIPFLLASILLFLNESLFAYVLFALSVYASDAAEFLSPVFLLILIGLNFKKVWANKSKHFWGFFIFVILLLPLFYVSTTNPLKHQHSINISTFKEGVNQKTLNTFVLNYFAHFTPKFLFETGDPNLRHGTGQDGVLYWSLLPFILIGIIYCLKNYKNKYFALLLIWLLIFPLGGSLTNDGVPHATRTLIGAPLFIVLAALGLSSTLKSKRLKYLTTSLFVISIIFEFANFAYSYFVVYPVNSQPWWDYGESQVFSVIKKETEGNESLCLSNIDYWHEETLTKYYLGRDNKYKITYDLDNPSCLISDILVLPSRYLPPRDYKFLETIYSLERNPIYSIWTASK